MTFKIHHTSCVIWKFQTLKGTLSSPNKIVHPEKANWILVLLTTWWNCLCSCLLPGPAQTVKTIGLIFMFYLVKLKSAFLSYFSIGKSYSHCWWCCSVPQSKIQCCLKWQAKTYDHWPETKQSSPQETRVTTKAIVSFCHFDWYIDLLN